MPDGVGVKGLGGFLNRGDGGAWDVPARGKMGAMNTPQDSSLGREVAYPSQYDPGLLFPIPRRAAREEIGVDDDALPFVGHDL